MVDDEVGTPKPRFAVNYLAVWLLQIRNDAPDGNSIQSQKNAGNYKVTWDECHKWEWLVMGNDFAKKIVKT